MWEVLPEDILAAEAGSAYPVASSLKNSKQSDQFFPWFRLAQALGWNPPSPRASGIFPLLGKLFQPGPSGCFWSFPFKDHGSEVSCSIRCLLPPIKAPGLLQSTAQPPLCPLIGAEERDIRRKRECVGLGLKMGTAKGV